jgi:tetratricopeptide (TPR) repeat protein
MVFEWYSGSDHSLEIPRELHRYKDARDSMSAAERVQLLRALLDREEDRNWRGAIQYMIGDAQFFDGDRDESIRCFSLAEKEFDRFAANFRDVAEEYCRTLYRLMEFQYSEKGSSPLLVDYGTRINQALTGPWLYEFERFMLFNCLGAAFNDLGNTHDLRWCYRIALGYYYSAHHLDPNEPGVLESIIYCLFSLDDIDACKAMYRVFLQVAERYEYKDRVDEFVRTRLGLRR